MANTVEICNIALMRVGSNKIQSLTENTRPAEVCNALFEFCRDSVLRDHQWNFARSEVELSELSQTFKGYDYAYLYPVDCLSLTEIYNSAKAYRGDELPVQIGLDETGNNKVILTNVAQATLIYTRRVTNSSIFDSIFIDCLAWYLASNLCEPLKGDSDKGEKFMRIYQALVANCKAKNANEYFELPDLTSSFQRARQ